MKNTAQHNDIKELAIELARLLNEKKAEYTKIMNIAKINSYFDFFLITTGNSQIHCKALARDIEKKLHEKDIKPFNRPDMNSNWIVVDCGFLIIHIFTDEMRDYYNLEKLWGDAEFISYQ